MSGLAETSLHELNSRLVWNESPHFPRAGVPQDQSAEDAEGYGCGRFGVRYPFRARAPGLDPTYLYIC